VVITRTTALDTAIDATVGEHPGRPKMFLPIGDATVIDRRIR